jgi:hypothetical protein
MMPVEWRLTWENRRKRHGLTGVPFADAKLRYASWVQLLSHRCYGTK